MPKWFLQRHLRWLLPSTLLLAALHQPAMAAITVQDDARQAITLQKPAQRIISLAPSITELLFAAGAGAKIVGVTDYSDYPPAAASLPRIGSSSLLDLERIIALQPDLIVIWGESSLTPQIAKLRALGVPVYMSEPRDFESIATALERFGELAGTASVAHPAAGHFRSRLKQLRATYAARAPVRLFYQVWKDPLMTLNDQHLVSDVIRLCGGENIFGKLPTLVPRVGVEAVLKADPEVIVAGSSGEDPKNDWRRFPSLTAVARGNLITLNSDWMSRAGPRILDGAQALCKHLDAARAKRATADKSRQ